MPHVVEELDGGSAVASFGPGPEMQVPGRVAAWDPPHRVMFDGGEGVGGLAFEWLIEAHGSGTCVVRFVNTGFGSGAEWDDQYDGMTQGWLLFLSNLRLHLEHFGGQTATPMLPGAMWEGPKGAAMERLTNELGLGPQATVGQRVEVTSPDAPALAGTVVEADAWRVALLVDEPCPGTAFLAVENAGTLVQPSVWCYFYGADGEVAAERDFPRWQQWLVGRGVSDR